MRTERATMMRAMTLAVGLGLGLAAATAPAALVTVSGSETWDGTANPHAADGVTLATNAGPVYVYTIPDGMTITGTGKLAFGANNVTLTFVNSGLHMDAGAQIDSNSGVRRTSTVTFFDMGANHVTGAGSIIGPGTWAVGRRTIRFYGSGNVTLGSVTMQGSDSVAGTLDIRAGGSATVGMIDVSSSDGASGSAFVRAAQVTVGAINAYSANSTSGRVRLDALAYPYFGHMAWETNSLANTLTLNGVIRTKGTTSSGGSIIANGVNLALGVGFGTNLNASTTFVLRRGSGGAFTDDSGKGFSAVSGVAHCEQPYVGAKPQILVYTRETWNGTANPRAADGVTLAGGTYTLPKEIYVTQLGAIETGAATSTDVGMTFTNGGLRMDSEASLDLTCPRNALVALRLALGGFDVSGGINVAALGTFGYGARGLIITNAGAVTINTISLTTQEGANGSVSVTAAGPIAVDTVDTRDTSGGGDSAGSLTLRGAMVDLRQALTFAARTTAHASVSSGNILLEALKPPRFDAAAPVNTKENHLVARGLLDSRGTVTHNNGNITLRGAIVTLESGFTADSNGVFAIYAGDREPHATYFINKSANPSFAATHNVQLVPPPGTMIAIR